MITTTTQAQLQVEQGYCAGIRPACWQLTSEYTSLSSQNRESVASPFGSTNAQINTLRQTDGLSSSKSGPDHEIKHAQHRLTYVGAIQPAPGNGSETGNSGRWQGSRNPSMEAADRRSSEPDWGRGAIRSAVAGWPWVRRRRGGRWGCTPWAPCPARSRRTPRPWRRALGEPVAPGSRRRERGRGREVVMRRRWREEKCGVDKRQRLGLGFGPEEVGCACDGTPTRPRRFRVQVLG
jgi:hypothetical protein